VHVLHSTSNMKHFSCVKPSQRTVFFLCIYPTNEDRRIFSIQEVVGSVAEPDLQRRDVLKFAVDASEWK
jgi:hypothetical protein